MPADSLKLQMFFGCRGVLTFAGPCLGMFSRPPPTSGRPPLVSPLVLRERQKVRTGNRIASNPISLFM